MTNPSLQAGDLPILDITNPGLQAGDPAIRHEGTRANGHEGMILLSYLFVYFESNHSSWLIAFLSLLDVTICDFQ